MCVQPGKPGSDLVPFHKLSQWLMYSLLEPFEQAGIFFDDKDKLTGLAEYRQASVFVLSFYCVLCLSVCVCVCVCVLVCIVLIVLCCRNGGLLVDMGVIVPKDPHIYDLVVSFPVFLSVSLSVCLARSHTHTHTVRHWFRACG